MQHFSLIFRRGAICELVRTLPHSARCGLSASCYSLTWNPTSSSIPGALAPALPRLASAGASPSLLFVHAHAQRIRRPVHHQLRMFSPKRFGDVAVPADRKMRLHRFLQLLRRDFVPLHRFPLCVNERRRVVVPMQLAKGLIAISTLLALIPATHNRCNQASPWRFLDLL